MADQSQNDRPDLDIGGDVIDSNIVIGNNNVINSVKKFFLFRDLKQLSLFITVLLLVAAGVTFAVWYAGQPRRMTGNFNVAVAQFGEIQPDGSIQPSASAEKISSTLFNFLDSEYKASGLGLTVQVAHNNMPLIVENAQAEKLARQVNADIVIFGNISVQGEQAEFSPRFFVAEQPDTQELTGQNELAYPISFSLTETGAGGDIHAQLRSRTEILFNFTKGLVYYSKDDLDMAARSAQSAINAAGGLEQDFAGQEALYLLAARIKMAGEDNQGALQDLEQALELNNHYARAYLARGNIFYTQAVEAGFDADLLGKAGEAYRLALEAPNQPEGAYIPIKAHTSLGNVLVVRAQQMNDPEQFAEAIRHYEYVTGEYERTRDPFLREFAAVAYFGLGAAYERQGQTSGAVKNYRRAYALTADKEFRARIKAQIKAAQSG